MAVDVILAVTYFAFLLGFGVIIANACKKYKIPDALFLLILGLVLGPTIFSNPAVAGAIDMVLVDISAMGAIPDFLRILALIMIVFTGTFNLSFRVFKKLSNVSLNLALVGVAFNTIVFGVIANVLFGLDWLYAFLLAAILSGTSTEVVVAFAKVMKGSRKPIAIMTIESIFNSPLTVLLPLMLIGIIATPMGALIRPIEYLGQFWLMIAGGVGTGIIVGLGVSKLLRGMLKEYTPLLIMAIALITYALTESIGGSGILAVAVCGLLAGNLTFRGKAVVKRFDDHISEMLRISVFTMLGAGIYLSMTFFEFGLALIFFLLLFLLRPLYLLPALGKEMRAEMSKRELALLSFVAPRGLSAAAIAPIAAGVLIAMGTGIVANSILNIIFVVILLSVLFSTVIGMLVKSKVPVVEEGKIQVSPVESTEEKDGDYKFIDISEFEPAPKALKKGALPKKKAVKKPVKKKVKKKK
jgi:NhaP-type Na+/H+ or K+/H+ antiporter